MAKDNFYIQKGGYLQFDAVTIEQYIKDQLNAGDSRFTDQNFEGSYFSSMIEVISYTFNVLMFYLNQTSSEAMFTDAQLYENMNRIVKMLGYNPIGYQTALLPYTASPLGFLQDNGTYNIPRYSYINAGGTTYSFNEDVVFKGDNLTKVVNERVLYQGKFYEYPTYSAQGDYNEVIFLTPGSNIIVDHFNIQVYVKEKFGVWAQWDESESLSLNGFDSRVFETRYNENGIYEIKFGNNVNGKQLTAGDSVAIYYLQSDGEGNGVAIGDLKDLRYVKFASPQFNTIHGDITESLHIGTIVPPEKISFDNVVPSTPFANPESIEDIRKNAPMVMKEKNTLARPDDFDRYVRRKFANVVSDVSVVDNWEYTGSYLRYFYNLGIDDPQKVSRILYNQVAFADSCNFNNVYIFAKPTITSTEDYNAFVSPALKQMIHSSMNDLKLTSIEPIVVDPVYMGISIGITDLHNDVTPDDVTKSILVAVKSKNSSRSDDAIITDINNVFQTYFNQDHTVFGMDVSFPELNDKILEVDGVIDFRIQRTDSDAFYSGLSMITWNPIYTNSVNLLLRSSRYEFFQVPYLHDRSEFINKIRVEMEA